MQLFNNTSLITFLFWSILSSINAISQGEIQSLAARALQQNDWDNGSWSGTWRDPAIQRPFTLAELGGQAQGSIMAFRVNPSDPRAGGADTITIVYQVPTLAWAAIGFSNNGGSMIGSEAVIALPDTNEVVKYNLAGKSVNTVQPMPSNQQTLVESGMIQQDGVTTMAFTKIMREAGEVPINDALNTWIGAWGGSNALGIHTNRQPFNVDLGNGAIQVIAPGEGVTETPVETQPPVGGDDVEVDIDVNGFQAVGLEGQLDGSTLQFKLNEADPNAGGQDTLTFVYTIPAAAWAAIAFSDNGGFMIGSEAVIGLPDEGTVLKYNLNGKNNAGVVPFDDAQQTLIDTSIVQDGETTILTFTKIMVENGEIPVVIGENTFLGAWGFANDLAIHAVRESFVLDLEGGGVQNADVRKESLWKAHGFIAGIAWGLLSPLAIAASVLRKIFTGGLWFKIHRSLNMLVVLATIVAFALAVVAINQETPDGASPQHFNPDPNPHKLIGLVIFIIAIVQALLGIFRPHVPEEGEEKSLIRFLWEVLHRCLGFICLGMAIYQVQSGIRIYLNIFASSADYILYIFWTVVGVIVGGTALGFISIKAFNAGAEESKPTKKQFDNDDDQEQPSA